MRRAFEIVSFKRNQPLIAAHVWALIDGHGEMATAEQLSGRDFVRGDGGGDTLGVKPRAGSYFAGRSEIDHQHAHRAVALRLQNKPPLEFEGRAQHDGQHDRFAEELGNRQRIVMAAQDGIDCGSEPHNAAAQIKRSYLERQDRIIEAGFRRLSRRNTQVGVVHRRQI